MAVHHTPESISPNARFTIPADYQVLETGYWRVNHRVGSTYPGYLMVAAKEEVVTLSALSPAALAELGDTLARVESLLQQAYCPVRVLFSKLGFSVGFACHFHVVPVHDWLLSDFPQPDSVDGNDILLQVNRHYCENQSPAHARQIAVTQSGYLRKIALSV